ncbi:MAG TPA: LytR C-terminal domain-containing protein [Marmoricola sp.]|nr:LytR C-terminal domain-containing protein [Marmoricola sp.]
MAHEKPEPPSGSADARAWLTRHRGSLALITAGVVGFIMVLWGTSELLAPFPKRGTATTTCDPSKEIFIRTMGRSEVTVSIYNAGAKAGTAGRLAAQFTRLGFKVSTVSNAPATAQIPVSAVVGPSTTDPATRLVALTMGPSATVTSDPALQLGPGINVFIGPKHHALAKTAPRTVRLNTPTVLCG